MKDQASLMLKIVDAPLNNRAGAGAIMLQATSGGLKLYDDQGASTHVFITKADINTPGGPVVLDSQGRLPALDGSLLTNLPKVDLSSYNTSSDILLKRRKLIR